MRPLTPSQQAMVEEAAAMYAALLTEAPEAGHAANWLHARGIDRDTAVTARLGYVGTDPFPGHERFIGSVVIPYLDHQGKALTMRFRCIKDHDHREFYHGKYMSLADDHSRVYGVSDIHEADDEIHVTEGEFDRLVLKRIGLYPIAIPGAHGWMGHHRRMLAGFRRVYVWGDGDAAGVEFVQRVTRSLRSAIGVRVPRDMDVTDIYLSGGAEALHALIKREDSE